MVAILIVGLINHFFVNANTPIVEEYMLGQEFLLPNNPNFSLTITKIIEEPKIIIKGQEYVTNGVFLLIYFDTKFTGNLSNLPADNTIPFSMSFTLKDLNNNEYTPSELDTKDMIQTKNLKKGESFYMFNIPKNTTGLKLIFTAKDINKFVVVDLKN